jgi:mRNA interferase MazF
MARILRGDVRWADLNPTRSREQVGQRPVLCYTDFRNRLRNR